MDLEAIAPILEDIIRQSLYQKVYPYGFKNYTGKDNKVASGSLARSVKVVTVEKKDEVVLQVIMNEYAQYVQAGRRPGKGNVPISSLIQWIKDRNLKGRNKKGRFITNESFAFAIQANIRRFGIKPAPFIDVSVAKIMSDPRITELIGDAAYEDLINAIEGI
jgi:hypothetical protein